MNYLCQFQCKDHVASTPVVRILSFKWLMVSSEGSLKKHNSTFVGIFIRLYQTIFNCCFYFSEVSQRVSGG